MRFDLRNSKALLVCHRLFDICSLGAGVSALHTVGHCNSHVTEVNYFAKNGPTLLSVTTFLLQTVPIPYRRP